MASNRKSGNLQDITKFKEYITVSARWVRKLRVKDIMASGRIVWKVTGKMDVGRNIASGMWQEYIIVQEIMVRSKNSTKSNQT